ncbi:DUF2254 domain-containing protein [Ruficoccus amylovorans]|uniref:DUF2254 domain-containing protein n=1 Tax=Ruficoccus amylovorans TaxID=1804625 RepID=A0A842HI27_9BACT|nr:DUF2254 domain-containing protein [Ruficoccus amylovorans]MBC2595214.1 DUF2254 domain-containing protein [Ruficoccus amylovorans]
MLSTLQFIRNRLAEALWVRPLLMCIVSVVATVIAYLLGRWVDDSLVPDISRESLQILLGVLSSGMLAIAVFAVGAMVSAYSSAGQTATPRAFSLIIADDVSQNALSTFIGAFLFSVIAVLALMNGFYSGSGRFFLLLLTLTVFWVVVITFIRWVDRIARLGRLGMTLEKVEAATVRSIGRYQRSWLWHACAQEDTDGGIEIRGADIGYLQRVDWAFLQKWATQADLKVHAEVLPGAFITPDRVLARIAGKPQAPLEEEEINRVRRAFRIGEQRLFDEDPRFGFIVLSEIASRALSPAVNDPGTAIQVTGQLVRLLHRWSNPQNESDAETDNRYDRVDAPCIPLDALFDDAFTGIARDGAPMREVMIRLQKAFRALAAVDEDLKAVCERHAEQALKRAKLGLALDEDYQSVADICKQPSA